MPLESASMLLWLPAWTLVLARMAGVVLALPVFSAVELPLLLKALLIVAVSAMVFPVAAPFVPADLTVAQAAAGLLGEVVIGEIVGLAAAGMLLAAQLAGHVVAQQSGLAIGSVFNPLFDTESTSLEQVWFMLAAVLFFALRGHVALLHVVLDSFRIVPPLAFTAGPGGADFVVDLMSIVFDVGLRLAGPALIAMLLTTLALGFLMRTMPQFNMLSVGFPLKLVLAIGLMAVTAALAEETLGSALWEALDALGAVFEENAARLRGGA